MPTMTITTTAPQAQRVATALGAYLGLGRDATASEIKAHFIEQMKELVLAHERRLQKAEAEAALPPLTTFDPS